MTRRYGPVTAEGMRKLEPYLAGETYKAVRACFATWCREYRQEDSTEAADQVTEFGAWLAELDPTFRALWLDFGKEGILEAARRFPAGQVE